MIFQAYNYQLFNIYQSLRLIVTIVVSFSLLPTKFVVAIVLIFLLVNKYTYFIRCSPEFTSTCMIYLKLMKNNERTKIQQLIVFYLHPPFALSIALIYWLQDFTDHSHFVPLLSLILSCNRSSINFS